MQIYKKYYIVKKEIESILRVKNDVKFAAKRGRRDVLHMGKPYRGEISLKCFNNFHSSNNEVGDVPLPSNWKREEEAEGHESQILFIPWTTLASLQI